jgi:hypothetical protein
VDEHLLAPLDVADLDQRLPGGQRDQRQRGRLDWGDRRRGVCEVGLLDGDPLGDGPDPTVPGTGEHGVAGSETLDPRTDGDHGARHIVTERERKLVRQELLELTHPDLLVQLVQSGGGDRDEHVVVAHGGLGHDSLVQGLPVAVDDERAHGGSPGDGTGPRRQR